MFSIEVARVPRVPYESYLVLSAQNRFHLFLIYFLGGGGIGSFIHDRVGGRPIRGLAHRTRM